MKSKGIKIVLNRKNQQFCAGVGMTKGELVSNSYYSNLLHPKEKNVLNNYKYHLRKESYLLGRLSAKQAIAAMVGNNYPQSIFIDTGIFQFPVVRCPNMQNIQVSISHCDQIGFSIAFPEEHPMGIDVEKISIDKVNVVLSQLTEDEKKDLKTYNNIKGFTALFSAKEALSKILRTGMMLDFKFLETEILKPKTNILECTFKHFGQYKALIYVQNEYVFSIALPKKTNVNLEEIWRGINQMASIAKE